MKLRSGIATAVTATALTFIATPALAATTHYEYPTSCYDVGSGQTACYTTSGHYNVTNTPSGNYVYAGQGHSTYSITDASGAVIYSTEYDYDYNFLVKNGVEQIRRSLYHSEYSQSGQTCEVDDNFLFANGEVRHDTLGITCS